MLWMAMVSGLLAGTSLGRADESTRGPKSSHHSKEDLEDVHSDQRMALVVGIDHYTDDPELKDLSYSAKDAQDISRVLSDPSLGGFDHISQLNTPQAHVSKDLFLSSLRAMKSEISAGDTFLLYFAGHGSLGPNGELYLMFSNTIHDRLQQTALPLQDLEKHLDILPTQRIVVILDTCHNRSHPNKPLIPKR